VLRSEAGAAPLPDACRACGAPVWQYASEGAPFCEPHSRLAGARARLALADADLARQARERDAAAPPSRPGAGPAASR
jgi:hypothetical protein